MFENIPNVKLGLIAVSRDCFPRTLSEMRRANIAKACEGGVYECPVTVENENDMLKAVADVKAAECNALVVFLGNFGPETPETLIARYFDGPCMFVAAAEGDGDLINGRGDAYCGMLNCSYNLGIRHLKGYIPEYPVGTAEDIAKMIADFIPIARAVIGVKNLTILGDYFVIANGTSTTHTKTLADEVEYQMTKLGIEPLHREGRGNGSNWIVLDYNDIIIHVFYKETRAFYQLERLWADGEKMDVTAWLKED